MDLEEMNRIKEERGYSFAQLAAYTGVPAVTLQKVFSGATKSPRRATMDAIERVLSGEESTYTGKAYHYEQTGKAGTPLFLAESPSAYHAARKDSVKKQGEYTIEDLRQLPDDVRMEVIDGVLYDITSSPTFVHQDCASTIHMTIYNYIRKNKGSCKVLEAPIDVQLDENDRHTLVIPDLLVVCDRSKIRRDGIHGAPDFILEILSPSTRRKDMTIKLDKYSSSGVREYWILDPDRQKLITYDLTEENWIPQIRNLEGTVGLTIFNGECQIDLKELADSIREFGQDPE